MKREIDFFGICRCQEGLKCHDKGEEESDVKAGTGEGLAEQEDGSQVDQGQVEKEPETGKWPKDNPWG